MFSSLFKKSASKSLSSQSRRGILKEDDINFLEMYASVNLAPDVVPDLPAETIPVPNEVPTMDGIVNRITRDVYNIMELDHLDSMRWKVPEGMNANTVAKRCMKKTNKVFVVESVGSLNYIRIIFKRS